MITIEIRGIMGSRDRIEVIAKGNGNQFFLVQAERDAALDATAVYVQSLKSRAVVF